MDVTYIGKWLVIAGLGLALLGAIVWLAGRLGLPFGQLPGDVSVQRGRFGFYFPIVTCIAISIVLTLVINLILRLLGK